MASTPYNVAVGGTDFGDTYAHTTSTYWSSTNSPTYGSALSYVPEIPWNDTCASQLLATFDGYLPTIYGPTGFCNSSLGDQFEHFVDLTAGGGGPSTCATGTPDYPGLYGGGTCQGWPKPSWQSVLGNPSDGVRDLPDVPLFAGGGGWLHSYVICASDLASCTGLPSGWTNLVSGWWGAGGTSFAAPIWAGFQALVNQKQGAPQGNPNPAYYSLASQEYGSGGNTACNSTLGNGTSASCIFYDITLGDNAVPCGNWGGITAPNCYMPSGAYGVLSTSTSSYAPAYAATPGWDFATGLGTVNVNNLVNNWHPVSPAVIITPKTASVKIGGSVQLTATSPSGGYVNVNWSVDPTGVGSLWISPSGVGAFYFAPQSISTASTSVVVAATLATDSSKQATAMVTVWNQPTCTLTATPTTTNYGGNSTLSWTTTNATSAGISNGVGAVTPVSSGSLTLTNFTATTTYTMTAANPAASGSCQATVTVSPVSVSVSPASASLVAGQTQQFTASVSGAVNTAVTWSASGGAINQSGLYTAPASITTQQTVTVTACSAVVPSSCGTATVTLMAPPVISPSSASLSPSGSQTFTVTVPGGGNSAVGSWTLSPSVGTLQWNVPLGQQVTYYAPSSITTQQTVTLKACLSSNSSLCGTATVTLIPPPPPPPPTCSLTVSPSLVSKGGSATLTWSTTNATTASINNGIGSVSPVSGGSKGISNAQATTTYTMTASNSGGSANCSATLNVCPYPLLPSGYCP